METDSRVDSALYVIIRLVMRFFAESTREWAEKTVDKLEGDAVREVTIKEAEELDTIPDTMSYFVPDEDKEIKIFAGSAEQRGLTALVLAFKYRMSQYWAIFVIPAAVYLLLTYSGGQTLTLMQIGIYFDLFGAVIVVRGLYRTPAEIDLEGAKSSMFAESPTGSPVDRLISAVETTDSVIGSSVLALGFALQLLAVSGLLFTISMILLILLVWIGLR